MSTAPERSSTTDGLTTNATQDDAYTVSLWSYINILIRWRLVIVGLPLALAIAVALWAFLRPRQFEARASFVTQEPPSMQGNFGQLAMQLGLAPTRTATNSPQFYVDLLQSRGVMGDVLTTAYNVAGDQPFQGTLLQFLQIHEPDTTEALLRGMAKLSRRLEIETNRTTAVITLAVRLEHPALAVAVANRFLSLLNDYNLRRRQSQAQTEREFVERRLREAQRDLRSAEEAMTVFLERNRDYRNAPLLRATFSRLERETQTRQALVLTLNDNFEKARIEEVRNTPVLTVIERPERLVEPVRRGMIRRAASAFLLGLVIAIGIAVAAEFVRNSARGDVPGYGQFVRLRREAFRGRGRRGER